MEDIFLATIWVQNEEGAIPQSFNLNDHLVQEGMAKIYMKK